MKTAIIYTSKTGATKTYAELLAEQLDDTTLLDLAHDKIDLAQYDRIVLGGGVRMGTAYKPLRSFMKKNLDALVKKPLWIFFSGVDTEGFSSSVKKNVPEELQQAAQAIVLLKGIAPFDKAEKESGVWLDKEALDNFAREINK